MIELGGNIKLDGFQMLDPPTMIVIKKMVGNYAKKINDSITPFEELLLNLEQLEQNHFKLNARITAGERVCDVEAHDPNLFFALDRALSKVMEDVRR